MNKILWMIAATIVTLSMASRLSAAGVQVWTSDVVTDDMSAKVVKELKPIKIIGVRNGTFSGKVVIESATAIKGAQATVSALTEKGGGSIPAQNIQLRYAKTSDIKCGIRGADTLLETPPEVNPGGDAALLPVWVMVKVPKEARAGMYTGKVTVAGVSVPLNLDVQDWTLPDTQDYRTFFDFVESPDSLALEYNVPLWSEQHWKLIARSFQHLRDTGARTLYVPLICRTNFGNEQSMVRWIPKSGNKYDYDFSVMDKYLDVAMKNMGKPKIVVFYVWDICMSERSLERGLAPYMRDYDKTKENRAELLGKGPRVTALDPVTKATSVLTLPRYEDKASLALWGPMFAEVRKRMEKLGLGKTMMLGLMPDLWPNKEEVTFWKNISGGLPWVIHGHAGAVSDVMIGNKGLYKIADIGYSAFVFGQVYNVNPDKGRMYGWRSPGIVTCFERLGLMNGASLLEMRELPAFDITGAECGGGRMGVEFWPVVRNNKGGRAGFVYGRYPENNWRNLDITDWILAPGPEGPLSTARLESLKEGLEVCEARIFLEDALLDATKKGRMGADLAKRCQDALDEHHRAMWKTVWNNDEDLKSVGATGGSGSRSPLEAFWSALERSGKKIPGYFTADGRTLAKEEATKGREWFVLGWQEREKKLFALAGEVAAKLNLVR